MKKLYIRITICLFACLFSTTLQAKEVNKQTAEKIAINAFTQLGYNKNISGFQTKEILTVKTGEKNAFYIVNFNPTGFIILSASDAVVPVLGSSTDSNFTFENLPPQLLYLLDSYKKQIKEIEDQNILPTDNIKQKWSKYSGNETSVIPSNSLKSVTTLPSQVAPLLSTTWNQNNGWNNFCPLSSSGPGGHCYVGCVGVAFAQVLYYWGCKVNESGTITDARYNNLSVDLTLSNYSWGNMGLSTPDNYNAKLIYDCAIAAQTQFGDTASSGDTYAAMNKLISNFGMKNSVTQISSSTYTPTSTWTTRLKEELSIGRPIVYEGLTGTSQTDVGHAWVIDGYDANDNFHCNWGWGNSSANNSYYNITNLHPTTSNHTFNIFNWATLGIEPVMSTCAEINGGSLICSSGASFNVPNLPAGATVTWDKSSNITFDNQPGNPKTFIANGTGSGWIEATIHYNGNATLERKTVWLGSPSTPTYINGFGANGMEFGQNSIYEFNVYPPTIEGVTNYEWQVGGGTILSGQGTNLITVRTASNPNGITKYFDVRVRVENSCGWSSYLWRTGFIGTGIGPMIVITPNPATSEATVELASTSGEKAAIAPEWELEVYSPGQLLKTKTTKLKDKTYKLNTQGWQDGVYVVRAKIGKEVITEKLLVKH